MEPGLGDHFPKLELGRTPEISRVIEVERWALRNLIEVCKGRLVKEGKLTAAPDSPLANLVAMINTRKIYGVEVPNKTDKRSGLKNHEMKHLQKMMVLHHKTICQDEVASSQSLTSLLESCCREEYEQFGRFQLDLNDIPYEWLMAMEDVQILRDRQLAKGAE